MIKTVLLPNIFEEKVFSNWYIENKARKNSAGIVFRKRKIMKNIVSKAVTALNKYGETNLSNNFTYESVVNYFSSNKEKLVYRLSLAYTFKTILEYFIEYVTINKYNISTEQHNSNRKSYSFICSFVKKINKEVYCRKSKYKTNNNSEIIETNVNAESIIDYNARILNKYKYALNLSNEEIANKAGVRVHTVESVLKSQVVDDRLVEKLNNLVKHKSYKQEELKEYCKHLN